MFKDGHLEVEMRLSHAMLIFKHAKKKLKIFVNNTVTYCMIGVESEININSTHDKSH